MGYHNTVSVWFTVQDAGLADRLNAVLDGQMGFHGGVFVEPPGQSRLGWACHAVFSHFDLDAFLKALRAPGVLADALNTYVVYYSEHWGNDRPVLFPATATEADVDALRGRALPAPLAAREADLLAALRRAAAPAFHRSLEEARADAQAALDAHATQKLLTP